VRAVKEATPVEGIRVLVVDDDTVDRMRVLRALEQLEAEAQEAADAPSALRLLQESLRDERPIDCVLSDLDMPGSDGAWLIAQIRAQELDVPVIVLTGHGDEQTAVAVMKAGASDYLPKESLTPERLRQALHHAIRLHHAEREIRRANQRLTLALAATGVGTWDLDLRTGESSYDERCTALLEGGVLGPHDARTLESSLAAIHPEDRPAVRDRMLAARDPSSDGRFRSDHRLDPSLSRIPGAERWVRALGQVFFAERVPVRFVGTLQDITESRTAEVAAQRRLEFEQQLIGIVSHDLRNPISAMVMGARLLSDRAPPGTPLAEIAARVASSGDRATRLIRDLLDFTQVRTGHVLPMQRRPTDLLQVVRQVADEVAMSHPSREIVVAPDGDAQGLWDPDRMAQLVGNLTRNAVSYSPPDSPVTMRTQGQPGRVVLEVHNRNVGGPIPEDVRGTLFEPYTRGDRRVDADRSVGLGLFIVNQIVAAHQGSVGVRSDADGTVFRVDLPRGPGPGLPLWTGRSAP
jgi:phosphoserine phosphatase RsbU/P